MQDSMARASPYWTPVHSCEVESEAVSSSVSRKDAANLVILFLKAERTSAATINALAPVDCRYTENSHSMRSLWISLSRTYWNPWENRYVQIAIWPAVVCISAFFVSWVNILIRVAPYPEEGQIWLQICGLSILYSSAWVSHSLILAFGRYINNVPPRQDLLDEISSCFFFHQTKGTGA